MSVLIKLILICFLLSCKINNKSNQNNHSSPEKEVDFKPFTYAITDSSSNVDVKLKHIDGKGTYVIFWGNESYQDSAFMDTITENRGYNLPPSIQWANESYICLLTNSTGPFSEHLFLPLQHHLDVRYFKEDIEWMDSSKNQICYIYIDNTDKLKTFWCYENLISGYKHNFEIPIYKNSLCYPWYSSITRKDNTIEIEPQGDYDQKVSVEIK